MRMAALVLVTVLLGVLASAGSALGAVPPRLAALGTDGTLWTKDGSLDTAWVKQTSPEVAQVAMAGDRIAVVKTNGTVWTKEGSPYAAWVMRSDGGIKQVVMDGDRIAALGTDGTLWTKEGSLDTAWVKQTSPEVAQVAMAGDRIAVVKTNGTVWTKEGSLDYAWVMRSDGGIKHVLLEGTRLAALGTDGTLWTKDGSLDTAWVKQTAPEIKQVAMAGDKVAVVKFNGTVWTKAGSLDSAWVMQSDGGINQVLLEGDRLAAVELNGTLWAKGSLSSSWLKQTDAETQQVVMEGNRVAVVKTNGTLWTKEGHLDAPWVMRSDGGIKQVVLSPAPWYPTSVQFGTENDRIDTDAEVGAVLTALGSAATDAAWNDLWDGMRTEEQARVQLGLQFENDSLLRDVSTGRVYLYANGAIAWVTNSNVAYELEYDLSTAVNVPSSLIASYRMANPITEEALSSTDEPSSSSEVMMAFRSSSGAHPAPASGYFWETKNAFNFSSPDNKASFVGTVHWYRHEWNLWKRYLQWQSGARSYARMPGECHYSAVGAKWGRAELSWQVFPPGAGVTFTSSSSSEGYTSCPDNGYTNAPDIRWVYRLKSSEGKTKGNIKLVWVELCSKPYGANSSGYCRSFKGNRRGKVEEQ